MHKSKVTAIYPTKNEFFISLHLQNNRPFPWWDLFLHSSRDSSQETMRNFEDVTENQFKSKNKSDESEKVKKKTN